MAPNYGEQFPNHGEKVVLLICLIVFLIVATAATIAATH